jgi:two-component system, NtrC family, sensor histidine kinase PilS
VQWKPLYILFIYRLCLSSTFIVFLFNPIWLNFPGLFNQQLFTWVSYLYVATVLVSGIALRRQYPGFFIQSHVLTVVDITVISLLMHASGGISSGLGILLIISIAAIGLLSKTKRIALLHPAIATLALFFEAFYSSLLSQGITPNYPTIGILGFTLFVSALLTQALARRAKISEELAKQSASDLASMEHLNAHIIRYLRSGIIVLDNKNNIVLINEAAKSLLKKSHIKAGMNISQFSPELLNHLQHLQEKRGKTISNELTIDDISLQLQISPSTEFGPYRTAIILEDNAQISQKLQQLKLASLGRLTASIAHEIRNPLGAIGHAGQLLQESGHIDKTDSRMIEIINNNVQRVNTIIENVLQLSRRNKSQPQIIGLHQWLSDFVTEYTHSHGIISDNIQISVTPHNGMIMFDPSHLHQVLTNIFNNAMIYGRDKNDEINISLEATYENGYPQLDINDRGQGLSEENINQLFEPFFTTDNKGTGLGLYIARELCECNFTKLDYIQQKEPGACFRLSFAEHQDQE